MNKGEGLPPTERPILTSIEGGLKDVPTGENERDDDIEEPFPTEKEAGDEIVQGHPAAGRIGKETTNKHKLL